jgi:hypothetical protein
VDAEYPVVDDQGKRQEVKHVRKMRPRMAGAIFPYALRIEAIVLQSR